MTGETDELTLVQRAAQGDEGAFREIVQRHESAVARTVTGMLGPGDDADDVGQETFVRLFHALPRFRGDAQLRTYLTRIAMNLCLDVLGRQRRRAGWVRIGDDDESSALAAPDERQQADRDERAAAVRRGVDGLEAKQKAVVVLRMLEERSTRETADVLGVPEGTVMSRLKRAMEKLETILAAELAK